MMRNGAIRGTAVGSSLVGLMVMIALASASAQVTYRTGPTPPDALPPIDAPPASGPAEPRPTPDAAPGVDAPVPPANVGAGPAAPPVDASSDKPDVNNPVKQTGEVVKDLAKGDVKALREGPLLVHGNFCGIGNRPDAVPTDALDEACMHHDACTTEGKLPSCTCNAKLRTDAMRIAQDPATPAKLQALAATMAASMAILICK